MPNISKEKIEQAIDALTHDVGYREAITMLQGLLAQPTVPQTVKDKIK
jgi:hypothetical protein